MSRNTSFGGFICSVLAVVVGCSAFFGLRQHFEKDDSSESETFIEGSESDSGSSIECVHADVDYDNVCDHCGIATKFEEVEIVQGEQAMGNWYRLYNYNCATNMIGGYSGSLIFSDGSDSFDFGCYGYYDYDGGMGLLVYNEADMVFDYDNTGIFEFHCTALDDHDGCEDEDSHYYDVYLEPGKTFTLGLPEAPEMNIYLKTFTVDENLTIFGKPGEYEKRLKVVAA